MNDVTRNETGKQKIARLNKMGEDAILEKIASGVLTTDLINELGVGWKVWGRWLRASNGREQRVEEARQQAAHYFAARAVKTAQSADAGSVNVARLQVDTDKWIASKFNRDAYDQRQAGLSVNLNVGDLYAQAQALINAGDEGSVIDGIWSEDPLWDEIEEDEDAELVEPEDLVNTFSGHRIKVDE